MCSFVILACFICYGSSSNTSQVFDLGFQDDVARNSSDSDSVFNNSLQEGVLFYSLGQNDSDSTYENYTGVYETFNNTTSESQTAEEVDISTVLDDFESDVVVTKDHNESPELTTEANESQTINQTVEKFEISTELDDFESDVNVTKVEKTTSGNSTDSYASDTEHLTEEVSLTEVEITNVTFASFPSEVPKESSLVSASCQEDYLPDEITNEFRAYIYTNISVFDIPHEFQSLLRNYFPKEACNLIVTAGSPVIVTWTDKRVNASTRCSQKPTNRLLKLMTNGTAVVPKFYSSFSPKFAIRSVTWNAYPCSKITKKSTLPNVKAFDVYIYLLGTLFLVSVIVMILLLFLRGRTRKHVVNKNVTPNTFQRYALRGRGPAFLSPELQRTEILAICNPVFIDETVEPKAKQFLEE